MKVNQIQKIIALVQENIDLYISSKGEATLVGVEQLSDKEFDLFDALYQKEIIRLSN